MIPETWMRYALALAKRGQGWVEPNPMVGAVIVRATPTLSESDGGASEEAGIVGEGWHRRYAGPHAEVEAIMDCRAKGVDPAGLTMVVTLEPCAHHGKTPPCADAVIEAKLGKVIAATLDPDDRVAGRGIAKLREAGVEVEVGLCEQEARRLNEPFFKRNTTPGRLPWVIGKWAQTLDGKIAAASGDSRWISSQASRQRVHEIRARMDAIMVGIGTVLADQPQLTARGVEVRRIARRVVMDPSYRLPMDSPLIASTGPPLTLVVDQAALERDPQKTMALRSRPCQVEVLGLSQRCGQRLDLRPLLEHLSREHRATNVLVEGGAGMLGSFLEQEHLDQVLAFVAPKITGDPDAVDAVKGLACERIADARFLELRSMERIGEDVLLDYRVRK